MKGKKVHSKPFKDEPTKNIFGKFQIIFENYNLTTIANVILVVFLIKFNETQGDIAKDNMIQSSSELSILESECTEFDRHEVNTDSIRNESVITNINMKHKQCFEHKQNGSMIDGADLGGKFKIYSATKGVDVEFNVLTISSRKILKSNLKYMSHIKQDHLSKLKLDNNNHCLNKKNKTKVTQNQENYTNLGIGNLVKNKKNNPEQKLVTVKRKYNEVNSNTSNKTYKNLKLIKPVDLLYRRRSRVLNVNKKLNSSSVQITQSKELLTDNTEKIRTAFELKHVRLPRRIVSTIIPMNSKFEYYSQQLNYTSMDRKLKNKLKINMRNNSNSRLRGKNIRKKKVKKSKKMIERALDTTYDTIYFSKKQDKASYKSAMKKGKYQNKNRINRTNYIKSLRKQMKGDIVNNAKLYGLLPCFNKVSLGVTLLKDARKTSDRINSSRIDMKYSTARHIVTTFKSKNDYYATLGRELINDYFTKQKKATVTLTLKVPDKNDDDDDEDDLEGAYTDIITAITYNPMTAYNNFRYNYSNDVYKFTHGITSWNNINNIIAIHLHTSPPTQQDRITCFIACRLQTMPSICPTRKRRVKVLMEDFALPQKTVFEMVWMGLLIVFFVLFCCGTPVFIIEQVKKRKVPPCVDKS